MTQATVLVVEDHPGMRGTLMRVIKDAGMTAYGVDQGEIVMKAIRKFLPDIIVLDVDLAGQINGIEVLRTIRSHPKTADLPVILHTSESGVSSLPEAELASLIMLKPADPDMLLAMIERMLKKARMESGE